MQTLSRVPVGSPAGGRFAAQDRAEAGVRLDDLGGLDAAALEQDALSYLRSILDDEQAPPSAQDATRGSVRDPVQDPEQDPEQRHAAIRALHAVDADALPPLTFCHDAPLARAAFTDVTTTCHVKPDGGLWLSPGDAETPSAWQQWRTRHDYRGGNDSSRAQPVALRPHARILVIDTREDLLAANRVYPGPPVEHPGFQSPAPLDFGEVAENFDAIWLTADGQRANHRTDDDLDLYGWDFESVLVLNPSAVDWPR